MEFNLKEVFKLLSESPEVILTADFSKIISYNQLFARFKSKGCMHKGS